MRHGEVRFLSTAGRHLWHPYGISPAPKLAPSWQPRCVNLFGCLIRSCAFENFVEGFHRQVWHCMEAAEGAMASVSG